MPDTSASPIDWQHPDVIVGLADRLMRNSLGPWLASHRPQARAGTDRDSLIAAIQFAGGHLDAYQMARFLEDSSLWASDTSLVVSLMDATTHRVSVIAELRQKHAAKTEQKQEPGPVPGDVYINSLGDHWELIAVAGEAPNRQFTFEATSHKGLKTTTEEVHLRRYWPEKFQCAV